jgi:hypothetical protein
MTIAAAMRQHLPGGLHGLEPTLDHHGYGGAGAGVVEDFGVPLPARPF